MHWKWNSNENQVGRKVKTNSVAKKSFLVKKKSVLAKDEPENCCKAFNLDFFFFITFLYFLLLTVFRLLKKTIKKLWIRSSPNICNYSNKLTYWRQSFLNHHPHIDPTDSSFPLCSERNYKIRNKKEIERMARTMCAWNIWVDRGLMDYKVRISLWTGIVRNMKVKSLFSTCTNNILFWRNCTLLGRSICLPCQHIALRPNTIFM